MKISMRHWNLEYQLLHFGTWGWCEGLMFSQRSFTIRLLDAVTLLSLNTCFVAWLMLLSVIPLGSYNHSIQVRALLGIATVELAFICSQGWRSAGEHWCAPIGYLQPVLLSFGPAFILIGWCSCCSCNVFWNVTFGCSSEKDTSWNLL